MSEERIKLKDTIAESIYKISEGNPGALRVIIEMLKATKKDGPIYLLKLDSMHIYGSRIWVGYKDICNYNIEKYIKLIKNRDPRL